MYRYEPPEMAIPRAAIPEGLRGHTFGNTVLRDHTTAHFGDNYATYHIHTGTDQQLTVAQSIAGLRVASAQAIEIITNSGNTTPSVREIQQELTNLRIIITGLDRFVNQNAQARTALVPVQDVITVLTQLVLVFAELENILARLSAFPRPVLGSFRPFGRRNDNAAAARLLNQLIRHNVSLALILQIIQR